MRILIIVIALAFIAAGCSDQQQTQHSIGGKDSALASDYRLTYKSWSGTSPGAGFTHTSLNFVELDLPNSKIRMIWKSATHPDPMLPYDDANIARLIEKSSWTQLAPEEASSLRGCIRAWLDTNPPATYNSPMQLGREDRYITSLSVTWGANTVSTTINPRSGYRKDDPLNPPEEWKVLLESLTVVRKVPDGSLQPRSK
jgi:hypothetical protein